MRCGLKGKLRQTQVYRSTDPVIGTGAPTPATVGRVVGNFSGVDNVVLPIADKPAVGEQWSISVSCDCPNGQQTTAFHIRDNANTSTRIYIAILGTLGTDRKAYCQVGNSNATIINLSAEPKSVGMRVTASQVIWVIDGVETAGTVNQFNALSAILPTANDFLLGFSGSSAGAKMWDFKYLNTTAPSKSIILPMQDGQGTTVRDASGNGNHGVLTDGTPTDFWSTRLDLAPEGSRYIDRSTNRSWKKRRVGNFSVADRIEVAPSNLPLSTESFDLICGFDWPTSLAGNHTIFQMAGAANAYATLMTTGYLYMEANSRTLANEAPVAGPSRCGFKWDAVNQKLYRVIGGATTDISSTYVVSKWLSCFPFTRIFFVSDGTERGVEQWDCNYTNYTTPSKSSFWPLREPSGTTCFDASGNGNNGTLTDGSPSDFRNTVMWVPVN